MNRKLDVARKGLTLAAGLMAASPAAFGALVASDIFNGNVGLSVDAVGSNSTPVGTINASIPDGATILKAYLYTAGTPYPWYSDSPRSAADYNAAGITLNGQAITNYNTIVGAISDRADIGAWYTGRADVTSYVSSWLTSGTSAYSWSYSEGSALNSRIDGSVLVVAYEFAGAPEGSVVLLDGGQDTGGETTTVVFGSPLTGTGEAGFFADMSLAISFSTGDSQSSTVDVNGARMSSAAGGYDDGVPADGGLITAGGIGDTAANPANPNDTTSSLDDELYSLIPFLTDGDTLFTLTTTNPSNDDNIFFMGLRIAANVESVNPTPVPPTLALLALGLFGIAYQRRTPTGH